MLCLDPHAPAQALNKAYLKQKPTREQIERFKAQALRLFERARASEQHRESEENFKTIFADFLKGTWYGERYELNTKGRQDLVIHNGRTAKDPVGVIIEAKRPANKGEMVTLEKPNARALHELLLYYLRERHDAANAAIKHLVVTDSYAWFVFDGVWWEQHVGRDANLKKTYAAYKAGGHDTKYFYDIIATNFFNALPDPVPVTHFNLHDVRRVMENQDPADDARLIPFYKILSPEHLLSQPFQNDSNSLNREFYNELLHLLGLEEVKEGSKKLIRRPEAARRHAGSFLENTLNILRQQDKLAEVPNPADYGPTPGQQLEAIALDLCITWLNRILFLKLLEGQLLGYHRGDAAYAFLNGETLPEFDHVQELFFEVLAKEPAERPEPTRTRYARVPYLNSSLFEPTPLERKTLFISSLKDSLTLPVYAQTVLRDESGRRLAGDLEPLDYLLRFLNAYDFASDGSAAIQEQAKTLINASVLGLIFEKINGYRDGSFFTPGFITMYMTRQTLRRAVVQRFNEACGWDCTDFDALADRLDSHKPDVRAAANALIDGMRLVDPAVGSGHFLVSALNELLVIKHDLGILQYRDNGQRVKHFNLAVANDELVVTDEEGALFEYHAPTPGRPRTESQRFQETLFYEKQTLIENGLFGVDINANSVKICRLRLWIELLKSAYYEQGGGRSAEGVVEGAFSTTPSALRPTPYLQTLPNLDINIKVGNSLVSRFGLDTDLGKALKSVKYTVKQYRGFVQDYKNTRDKEVKRGLEKILDGIKASFRAEIAKYTNPKVLQLQKLSAELYQKYESHQLFGGHLTAAQERDRDALAGRINALRADLDASQNAPLFGNAFEWRFEFPEVLDEDGGFAGFDVVLGNPPYIRQEELAPFKPFFQQRYRTYAGTADLYVYFVELGLNLLRPNGQFTYILPNKWMRGGYGAPLRAWMKQRAIVSIDDFGDLPVFDEATTYPCVLSLQHAAPRPVLRASAVDTLTYPRGLDAYLRERQHDVPTEALADGGWVLTGGGTHALLDKLRGAGKPLKEYVDNKIYRGVLTGLNEAFVIDAATRQRLIAEDPRSAEVIKPFLAGRDIKRYQTPGSDKFLIFTRRGIRIEEYPAVLRHLEQFREKLEPKPKDHDERKGEWKGRKAGTYAWYEIQDAVDYFPEFEKAKIIIPSIIKSPENQWDEKGFYSNDKTTIISTKEKYVLALLNSPVADFIMQQISATKQGGFFEYKPVYLAQIPIPNAPAADKAAIERLVETILAAKKDAPSADTSALEAEIDALVYGLYGLTPEEIALVEGRPSPTDAEPVA